MASIVITVSISLDLLFPVEDVRQAAAGRPPLTDAPRHGHVSPVAAIYGFLEDQPTMAVELAFYPIGDVPEFLTEESWVHYREKLGLAPFAGPSSLRGVPDDSWRVEFGPHALISNPLRHFQFVVSRPDAEWEEAVKGHGSCAVVLGSGLGADDETGVFGIPSTAAALTAAYAGSWALPELADIPGLHVVPLNSLRPYDPMRPVTFVLDTSVLIAMQRLCFAPERLGATAQDVRHLVANLLGRDVLPGPALSQLRQPARMKTETRSPLEALAAFDLLMARSRAEVMDERRRSEVFDPTCKLDVSNVADLPHMLWMYAGVLRLRQVWSPYQTLGERAQSFEAYMRWLQDDLRLNAALLVQVAFNLWIADKDAHHQASRLLRFRAGSTTDLTLGELWGTAYDLLLVSGQADALQVPQVVDVAILTFDRGLAGMRDFFEHVGVAEIVSGADTNPDGFAWSARVKLDFHPGLGHLREHVEELITGLQIDMLTRVAERDTSAFDDERLRALVDREERLVKRVSA